MRVRSSSQHRRGQSLLIVFVLLIALVGILLITLDFGFVLLSRRTLQTAVNTGALEGARDTNGEGRASAQTVIRNVFDDDLDPSENSTTLGAGPDQSLVQRDANDRPRLGTGTSAVDLSQNRPVFIYRPNPELNESNALHGDLVRGEYDWQSPTHAEGNDYSREDFDNTGTSAFLARIRRTPLRPDVANPLDRQAGVSSSGSGSPLLIGHLAWFAAPNSPDIYDIRRDGISIRATAIAVRVPSVVVYPQPASDDTDRFYPIADVAFQLVFAADNTPTGTTQWFDVAVNEQLLGDPPRLAIGAQLTGLVPTADPPLIDAAYYPVIDQDNRIIGFELIHAIPDERLRNESPRLQDAWVALGQLPDEDWRTIQQRNRNFASAADNASQVPALVGAVR